MPHRRAGAGLGGDLRRRAARARASRRWTRSSSSWCRRADGLIRLLTPPFDRTPHDPGYIKGYVPGVRENGGQYTHAALWVVRALAELGRRDRAARAARDAEPGRATRATPRAVATLPGRAVRRRRRRLRRAAARRARRLDLVHRLGRLDVPRRARVGARPALEGGQRLVLRPVRPGRLAGVPHRATGCRTAARRYAIAVRNAAARPLASWGARGRGRPLVPLGGAAVIASRPTARTRGRGRARSVARRPGVLIAPAFVDAVALEVPPCEETRADCTCRRVGASWTRARPSRSGAREIRGEVNSSRCAAFSRATTRSRKGPAAPWRTR